MSLDKLWPTLLCWRLQECAERDGQTVQDTADRNPCRRDVDGRRRSAFPITVVTGGFPCQPFSVAGKQRGTDDDRYLWPEMLRVIREVSPRWVVAENVYGLVSYDGGLVLRQVYVDLEAEGYETMPPIVLPACGVGAPHRRYRVYIVAHDSGIGRGTRRSESERQQGRPGSTFGSGDVADTETGAEWAGLCQNEQTGERWRRPSSVSA